MRTVQLISAILWFLALPIRGEGSREAFLAEASYDASEGARVIKITAKATDISVVQLSISRPYADVAGLKEPQEFSVYVVPHDESDTKAVRALIDQANKDTRFYRENFSIGAHQSGEVRFPARKAPDLESRIMVGAELFRSEARVGVYLEAKLK